MTNMEETAEVEPNFGENSLIDIVFSWSIKDIFNNDLYKDEVKVIPKTFISTSDFMKSFMFPLIEETRADLCSNMDRVSSLPICEMLEINESENFELPRNLLYDIVVDRKGDVENDAKLYEPEIGDLIAITDVKPKCIDDLDKPMTPFFIALVRRVRIEENCVKVCIILSKPIDLQQAIRKDLMKNTLSTAVFLSNLTTYIRIWKALNFEFDGKNTGIIEKVLQPDSTVRDRCNLCLREGTYRASLSRLDPEIRPFNLNESQKEAVLKCIAAKSCDHENAVKVKLIWGPPGTGKTKTTSVLLYSLLRLKCKTLTCAPTNIAILEVTKRLHRLIIESFQVENHGLGDIILVGHSERLKINDNHELLNIYLNYRVRVLVNCLAPSSGWKHCLAFMISLLEDPEKLYLLYLKEKDRKEEVEIDDNDEDTIDEGQIRREKICREKEDALFSLNLKAEKTIWGRVIAQTLKKNKKKINWNSKVSNQKEKKSKREIEGSFDGLIHEQKKMNLEEFLKKRFDFKKEMLNSCIANFITHLPTCCITLSQARSMMRSLILLEYLGTKLKQLLDELIDEKRGKNSYSAVNMARKECIQILRSFQEELAIPNLHSPSSIKLFCLENACLFFCTTSSSAKLHVTSMEFLVVDEAAMVKECESVIPFQIHGLRHAILIGDDCQLPALVKSKISKEAEFGRSLFGRLVLLGYKKHLLNVQYRMHPLISLFPNKEFYQKQILDAPNVKKNSYERRFLEGDMYGSFSFINVAFGDEEVGDGRSMRNMVEAALVSEVVANIFKESTASKQKVSVGIISPYNAQVYAIQEKLGTALSGPDFSASVRSVDGFQGGEEDIIIISTVRHNVYGNVGFLDDRQRTNVALTRARYCLWIFGNEITLKNSGSVWKKLIVDAKARGCFYNAYEDKNLAIALIAVLIDIDLIDVRLNIDSLLFKDSRWMVRFDVNFWKSMASFTNLEIRKDALSLLTKLSTGWRCAHNVESLNVKDGIPFSEIVKVYKITGRIYIIWSIDIIEEECSTYNQVLKVWDLLPLSKIPDQVKRLDNLFGSYSAEIKQLCKLKFVEGSVEVPMSWPVNSAPVRVDPMQILCYQFAALTLKDDESCV